MKIILESQVGSISATTEDAAYPVENLLDDHPKKMYKVHYTTDKYTEIKIGTAGVTGALGLVNIVADRASIYIENPNGIEWDDNNLDWDNVDWVEYPESIFKEIIFDQNEDYSSMWVEFFEFDTSVDIIIKLYVDNVYDDKKIGAGVVKVGRIKDINDIIYPVNISLIDYSFEKMLSNGSYYYKKRDIVKRISGQLKVDYQTYDNMMFKMAKIYGKRPAMFNIQNEAGCKNIIVYCRLSTLPSTTLQNMNMRILNFEITEVI